MGFAVFQGILDGTILIFLAVVLAYVRVTRRQLRRLSRDRTVYSPGSAVSGDSGHVPDPREVFAREVLEERIGRLDELSREAAERADRLKLLLHDAQQWLEDLERLEKKIPPPVAPPESGMPAAAKPSRPAREAKPEPRTDIEKVLYLMEQGRTVPEIAQALGRGEGEIELMLGLSRLSDGRTGAGR
ncbi:MAG: DUF6115 domain-containing protein [Leptospirillum sp.]